MYYRFALGYSEYSHQATSVRLSVPGALAYYRFALGYSEYSHQATSVRLSVPGALVYYRCAKRRTALPTKVALCAARRRPHRCAFISTSSCAELT